MVSGELHHCDVGTGGSVALPRFFSGHFERGGGDVVVVSTLFVLVFFAFCATDYFIAYNGLFSALFNLSCRLVVLVNTTFILLCAILNNFLTRDTSSFVRTVIVVLTLIAIVILNVIGTNNVNTVVRGTHRVPKFLSFFNVTAPSLSRTNGRVTVGNIPRFKDTAACN